MNKWNPRYTAYAIAHGKTEAEMLRHDKTVYSGGCMAGFMIWIDEKWHEWKAINSVSFNAVLSDADYKSFDDWLKGACS